MAAITKISTITTANIAEYLKLDYATLTDAEKTELETLLGVAKSFIRSYTGINELTIYGESIGTGDGETTVFNLEHYPIIPASQTVYVDEVEKTLTTDYTINDITGRIELVAAPAIDAEITADYSIGLDAYQDFVIAVYILVQDMYDNRTLYIDKGNLNKVVETILGMHCLNLL